jgi:hypothetical protein
MAGDYAVSPTGLLAFAPGETSKTIIIDVLGDLAIEEHESLSVVLFDVSGATIGSRTAIGTILNDDTSVGIVDSVAALEGDSGTTDLAFTVALEKSSALPVTVELRNPRRGGSKWERLHRDGAGAQITFAPGETIKDDSAFMCSADTTLRPMNHSQSSSRRRGMPHFSTALPPASSAMTMPPQPSRSATPLPWRETAETSQSHLQRCSYPRPSELPAIVEYATMQRHCSGGHRFHRAR